MTHHKPCCVPAGSSVLSNKHLAAVHQPGPGRLWLSRGQQQPWGLFSDRVGCRDRPCGGAGFHCRCHHCCLLAPWLPTAPLPDSLPGSHHFSYEACTTDNIPLPLLLPCTFCRGHRYMQDKICSIDVTNSHRHARRKENCKGFVVDMHTIERMVLWGAGGIAALAAGSC